MNKNLLFIFLFLFSNFFFSQTLTEKQIMNARATGYAIIAAKNPGKSFSVLVIPWDKVNSLEYNANTQINSGWHPQAVIKGNYFDQQFDGSDFSTYSTVLTSQEDFDKYKNTGTQWWIVCSTLSPFSKNFNFESDLISANDNISPVINKSFGSPNAGALDFGDGSGWNFHFRKKSNNQNLLSISDLGNASLIGKFEAKEIKVTTTPTADFVFAEDYQHPTLEEVEKHIKEKKHLPEIASAEEMEKEGVNVGEFQIKLLQKIEELTLYSIEQNKQLKEQNIEILKLKKELEEVKKQR